MLKEEKFLLENLPKEYRYLTMDDDGILFLHTKKPEKVSDTYNLEEQWLCNGISSEFPYNNFFDFVESDKIYSIKDLLESEVL